MDEPSAQASDLEREWRSRLAEIAWSRFLTAYGPADRVPVILMKLLSTQGVVAMKAARELDMALCHQHVYVSSGALPAWPFVVDAIKLDREALSIELMVMVRGIAACLRVVVEQADTDPEWRWTAELHRAMAAERQSSSWRRMPTMKSGSLPGAH